MISELVGGQKERVCSEGSILRKVLSICLIAAWAGKGYLPHQLLGQVKE